MCTKGFDENGFMEWMETHHILNDYAKEIIHNIIWYAQTWEHVSKDQLAYFITDMLPGVQVWEVAQFCEDEILTDSLLDSIKSEYGNVKTNAKAKFISIWDGEEIETDCMVNLYTKEVYDIQQSNYTPDGICEGEYVEIDGERYEVIADGKYTENYWYI
jgi:hypothetical protein